MSRLLRNKVYYDLCKKRSKLIYREKSKYNHDVFTDYDYNNLKLKIQQHDSILNDHYENYLRHSSNISDNNKNIEKINEQIDELRTENSSKIIYINQNIKNINEKIDKIRSEYTYIYQTMKNINLDTLQHHLKLSNKFDFRQHKIEIQKLQKDIYELKNLGHDKNYEKLCQDIENIKQQRSNLNYSLIKGYMVGYITIGFYLLYKNLS